MNGIVSNIKEVENTENSWQISTSDKILAVSHIALKIILVSAIALSVYFGYHPLGHVYILTSKISFSLACIVTTSTGAFVFLTLCIPRYRSNSKEAVIKILAKKSFIGEKVRKNLVSSFPNNETPASGEKWEDYQEGTTELGRTNCYKTFETVSDEFSLNLNEKMKDIKKVCMEYMSGNNFSGIWIEQKVPTAKTVIVFHGNGEWCLSMRIFAIPFLLKGYNVCLAEYTGTAIAKGNQDLYKSGSVAETDAKRAYNFVLDYHRKTCRSDGEIIACGHSLGCSYALMSGASSVILTHPFSTPWKVARSIPIISEQSAKLLVKYALGKGESDKWNNLSRLGGVNKLVIISGKMDLIMRGSGKELYERAQKNNCNKLIWKRINGGHNWSLIYENTNVMIKRMYNKLTSAINEIEQINDLQKNSKRNNSGFEDD